MLISYEQFIPAKTLISPAINKVIAIIKATINAYKDSNKINVDDTFIDNIAVLGMYLRVIYRKSNEELKNNINKWIKEIKDNNFYNNFYLFYNIVYYNLSKP